jgi:hypothetical protein
MQQLFKGNNGQDGQPGQPGAAGQDAQQHPANAYESEACFDCPGRQKFIA